MGRRWSQRRLAVEPLEERCMLALTVPALHSDQGAAHVIYLDFDGQQVRNTPWNTVFGNIDTLPFSEDADYGNYSATELADIQSIWERVAEDFRPFDVDVTTVDPGMEALKHAGGNDTDWGIRVVIGGKVTDWYALQNPGAKNKFVAQDNSFFSQVNPSVNDTCCFVFSGDLATNPPVSFEKSVAETASHAIGRTLGLQDATQTVPDPQDPTKFINVPYAGHGTGVTSSAPIMGDGTKKELTQWSQGEFPFATQVRSELDDITNSQTGVTYRTDDHGSTRSTADSIGLQAGAATEFDIISDQGIIEKSTDIDYFTFTVEGFGGIVNFDIATATTGTNLDILAKIYDAGGAVLYTSNPVHELGAGGATLATSPSDGGWVDSTGEQFDELNLASGTYYLSIQGSGKAREQLTPSSPIDWGYSDYGSLGAYTISGLHVKELVVGVDFDTDTGASPLNWNLYSGGGPVDSLGDPSDPQLQLISESGKTVPYTLTISTTGESIDTFDSSNGVDMNDLPARALPLDDLDGYIASQDETLNFVWGNLQSGSVYQIYVFGHSDSDAQNVVTVTGGMWNGEVQTYNFTQVVTPDSLAVNDTPDGTEELSTRSLFVVADDLGQITITVTNPSGFETGLGGLAIALPKSARSRAKNGTTSMATR